MPTPEITSRLSELLTTLTPEAKSALIEKCASFGFDLERGDIPIEESFINLDYAANILRDAVAKGKLKQMPLSVQKHLLASVEGVARAHTNLMGGSDDVENFKNAIEQLTLSIWQFGLNNLSGEVLGFQEKMNQLKHQEVAIAKLHGELKAGLESKRNLDQASAEMSGIVESCNAKRDEIQRSLDLAQAGTESIRSVSQEASALRASTEQSDALVTQQLSAAKVSTAEVQTLEAKVREFFSEIGRYREQIERVGETATKTVKENDDSTKTLAATLKTLEDQIRVQIEKATGYSLFHSFQKRQETLARSKMWWAAAVGVLVLMSVGLSVYLIWSHQAFDATFYIKLSMSLPLIFALTFCTVQYSRERALEEEYAFKSNISISLEPYQSLVSRLLNKDDATEKAKFSSFIIEAITKVFTPPSIETSDAKTKGEGLSRKVLHELTELVGTLNKSLRG